jgi:hypothetical protein
MNRLKGLDVILDRWNQSDEMEAFFGSIGLLDQMTSIELELIGFNGTNQMSR